MSAKRITLFVIVAVVLSLTAAQCVQPAIVEKEVVVTQEVVVEKEVVVTQEVEVEVPMETYDIDYWIFAAEGGKNQYTGELYSEYYERVIDEYEAEHPNVNIDFSFRGAVEGGTTTFIDAAVAAGDPPDIYYDADFRAQKYAQAGLLENVDDALTPEDRAAYNQTVLATEMNPDGTLWAIPAGMGFTAYIANKTLFENAGALDLLPEDPDRVWTTDEYMEACRAVNDPDNNVYCTVFYAKDPSSDAGFNNFFAGWPGCDLFDMETKQYVVNSPECVEAMTWLHNLQEEGLIVPGPAGLSDIEVDGYWVRQEVALLHYGFWFNQLTQTSLEDGTAEAPFEYVLINYPQKPGAPPAPMGTWIPHVWTVFKQEDPGKRAAIMDFVNYMQQPERVVEIAAGWGEVAVRQDAPNWYEDDPDWEWVLSVVPKTDSKNYYYSTGVPCNYNEVRQAWAEARQDFWDSPVEDIPQILADFEDLANSIIAECE
jgi:multiple sugar transport system substrate-binding protein